MFSRTAARAIRGTTLLRNYQQVGLVRRYSVVKDERSTSSLPLAGYRVLDMTRVLAGVCSDDPYSLSYVRIRLLLTLP